MATTGAHIRRGAKSGKKAGGSADRRKAPAPARRKAATASSRGDILLSTHGLTKSFGDFTANDGIDFDIRRGEIHALLGENGAGKSTFVKLLYGLLQPDSGYITWKGRQRVISDPQASRRMGIGMVFQHFSLFETLTVVNNIRLALPPQNLLSATLGTRTGDLARRIEKESADYGIPLDASARIADLSVGVRQRVEVMRCLLQSPSLLIMDEPTSVLTPQEVDQLFGVLRRLTDEGKSVLFISHKLDEVIDIADRATILRDGRKVATTGLAGKSVHRIGEMMVGREVDIIKRSRAPTEKETARVMARAGAKAAGLIEVEDLNRAPEGPFEVPLNGINISVAAGEILGIAGVAGNGQSELMDALTGEWRSREKSVIFMDGEDITHLGPAARRTRGIGLVPEERNGHAAVGSMTIAENTLLTGHDSPELNMVSRLGVIDFNAALAKAGRVAAAFDVRLPDMPNPPASALSGGNVQKFVMGREIIKQPKVLIVAQPTWGVDIGATQFIHKAITDLAAAGSAVILISNDLEEIFAMAHEISVMHNGKLTKPAPARELTAAKIGLLMGGIHDYS